MDVDEVLPSTIRQTELKLSYTAAAASGYDDSNAYKFTPTTSRLLGLSPALSQILSTSLNASNMLLMLPFQRLMLPVSFSIWPMGA